MKPYKKLGFTHLESAEIVTALNKLLANYHIHYQKLRKFHWTIVGTDFFDLHNLFEEEYRRVQENIDAVAERIRVFGKFPLGTFKEYLELAEIEEIEGHMTSMEMVREILDDYETLLSFMVDVNAAAANIGDGATDDMITGFIKHMEKRHWMLSAWSTNSTPALVN